MSAVLASVHQTERLEDLVTAFGQTALATTGLLVGVAGGLLTLSGRDVVITSRDHALLRTLVALLMAVTVAWIAGRLLSTTSVLSARHLHTAMRDTAYAQGGVLLLCVLLIGVIVRKLAQLVQVADS
jgi:hypothetical protein